MDYNIRLIIGILVIAVIVVSFRRVKYGPFRSWPNKIKNYTLNSGVFSVGWIVFLAIKAILGIVPSWQYWMLAIVLFVFYYFVFKQIDKKYPR